jgi:hypothetical protein
MQSTLCCTVCHSENLHTVLDFGRQPPANRFMNFTETHINDETYRLALGLCNDCSIIQLTERMPLEAIRPRYEWLIYNEPEGHLDDVASNLSILPGIDQDSLLLGITYKDESTLERLKRLGVSSAACIQEHDLRSLTRPFGLESIQNILQNDETLNTLKKKYGKVDMLIVRHIIEHASSAKNLLLNMSKMLKSGGYMVLEMPDSEHIFQVGNHGFIWEEHISYFTENAIFKIARSVGAEVVWIKRYPYPYEDSLVAVLRFNQKQVTLTSSKDEIQSVTILLENFAKDLESQRSYWRKKLEEYKAKGMKVAVFGAGHLSVKFINFLQLVDLIDCVIDDHPKKNEFVMPGSHLPIVPSSELNERGIRICISTLSPESETKVRNNLPDYFSSGGIFIPASITQS